MLDFLAPYWNFLLVHPLISLLVGAYDLVHDFGFAIVFITIVIRLALYPLFRVQIQNQRATQLISSVMFQPKIQPKNVDPQQKMMQSMQYYFPLLTIFIAWQLPAGLALYWVT